MNAFCRELFVIQATSPERASSQKPSPTGGMVAQVELTFDQVAAALRWEPAFSNPADTQVGRLLGELGHLPPSYPGAVTGQVVRAIVAPSDLPDWVDWGTPGLNTWYGALAAKDERGLPVAQENGFSICTQSERSRIRFPVLALLFLLIMTTCMLYFAVQYYYLEHHQ